MIRKLIILTSSLTILLFLVITISSVVFRNKLLGEKYFGKFITNTFYSIAEPLSYFRKVRVSNDNYYDKTEKDFLAYDSINNYPNFLISYRDGTSNYIEIIDPNKEKIKKKWVFDLEELRDLSYNKENFKNSKGGLNRIKHPLLNPTDSTIVFHNGKAVFKYKKNKELIWVNNEFVAHHAINSDSEGNIYSCGRRFNSERYDFLPNYEFYGSVLQDDKIFKLDKDSGKILFEKSIINILIENGYFDLLIDDGEFSFDPIHLNDITVAQSDSECWNKDDLLISSRTENIIFLYRPTTNQIIWLKKGPWLNQHDPDFLDGCFVSVFGNDVLDPYKNFNDERIPFEERHFINKNNQLYIVNIKNDSVTTPYNDLFVKAKIKTPTAGQATIFNDSLIFIESTDESKIIMGNKNEVKLEFTKHKSKDRIYFLSWSRLIL